MVPLVLLTRPLPQSRDFAALVPRDLCDFVMAPLLDVQTVTPDWSALSGQPDAVIVTSARAFAAFEGADDLKTRPLYAVGPRTAEEARARGFHTVIGPFETVGDLCAGVMARVPRFSRLLYVRGEDIRMDLRAVLSGYPIDEVIAYKALPVAAFPATVVEVFPQLHAVTLFSPRSGQIFLNLLRFYGLEAMCARINLLSLSSSVLESVGSIPWKSVRVAEHPDSDSMVSALTHLLRTE